MTTHKRVGQCQMCQKWVPRDSLRKMPHDMKLLPGENRLSYSDWNALGWATDNENNRAWATANYPALGVDGNARIIVNDDNTLTRYRHSVTWMNVYTGPTSSTVYTTIEADFTGATNVCFSIEHGLHQQEQTLGRTVAMGTCDKTGNNKQEWFTRSLTDSGNRLWFSVPLASVTDVAVDKVCFYITVTSTLDSSQANAYQIFYLQMASAEDAMKPGPFYETNGSPLSYATDQVHRITMDTCPECKEKVFAYRNLRGKARKETDPIIPLDTWEG